MDFRCGVGEVYERDRRGRDGWGVNGRGEDGRVGEKGREKG